MVFQWQFFPDMSSKSQALREVTTWGSNSFMEALSDSSEKHSRELEALKAVREPQRSV